MPAGVQYTLRQYLTFSVVESLCRWKTQLLRMKLYSVNYASLHWSVMSNQYFDLSLLCFYVFILFKCVGLMCFHQPYCKVCNAQVQTKNNGNKSVSATRWYHESLLCYASRFYDRLAARRIFCRHCKQDHRRWRKSNPELLAYFSFWQICFATFKLQPLLFLLISPSVMQIIWDLLLRLIYLSSFLSPLFRGVFFLHFTVATNKGTSKGPIFCL